MGRGSAGARPSLKKNPASRWASLALLVGRHALASPASDRKPAPLVDGGCTEYVALDARSERITDGMTLYMYQDRDHVWLWNPQPACALARLIAHCAANARWYAGRASPRAT